MQVVIPLIGALLAGFLRRGATAFAVTLIVSWMMPVIAGAMLWQVLTTGPISYHLGGWAPPWGIEYRVDLLNAFVLVLVSTIGAVIIPSARRSVAFELEERREAWFYCMYLLCLTGLLGIAVTGDAFNAFVFLEISSLSTYVLIALGADRRALLSSFQYLIMGTIGATFYVIGVGLLYLLTGTLNMVDIASRLGPIATQNFPAMVTALAFLTVGISLKLALFPLHVWLPNAYAYAPSWATVFLSATATKVAIYLLIRYYFSVFGVAIDIDALPISEIMIALSLAAMFIASLRRGIRDQREADARLFVGRADRLHHARHRARQPSRTDRRARPYRQSRNHEGDALPRDRRSFLSCLHGATQRTCGHRPQDADHDGGVHDRGLRPCRHARYRRLHLQMVSGGRRARQGLVGIGVPDRGEFG